MADTDIRTLSKLPNDRQWTADRPSDRNGYSDRNDIPAAPQDAPGRRVAPGPGRGRTA